MKKTNKLLMGMAQFALCLNLVQELLTEYPLVGKSLKADILRRFDETNTPEEAKQLYDVICAELAW